MPSGKRPEDNTQKVGHGYHIFLSQGTLRFGELSRKMPQVTQANLTKELRMLEEYMIIHREIYKEIPPKVEYSLTELGVRLGIIASNLKGRLKWFY